MKCFICGNKNKFTPLFPELCTTENYLCEDCGLVFIPRKRSFQEYYKMDGYFEQSPNLGLRSFFVNPGILAHLGGERLGDLEKLGIQFVSKNVLDVGCGYGEILYAIKNKYPSSSVLGIEPSSKVATQANQYFDIEVLPILLEEYVPIRKFDIILCNHTLEHVDDPIKFVKLLKRLLKPNGILYIEVPNVLVPSGGFSLNKFFYNEHLQTFSAYNLERFLNNLDMELVQADTSTFLKFICKVKKAPISKQERISAQKILDSLREYKLGYQLINHIKVYIHKASYLIKVLRYKFH